MTKTDWLLKFNYEAYFSKHAGLSGVVKDGNLICKCPFHDDNTPSFSVQLQNPGLWKCFAGCGGGNLLQFHTRLFKMRPHEADEELRILGGDHKVVSAEEIQERRLQLQKTEFVMDWLRKERGYNDKTIADFELGFDGQRIWIPIKFKDHYLNVRKWDYLHTEPGKKFIQYGRDYGEARLLPY